MSQELTLAQVESHLFASFPRLDGHRLKQLTENGRGFAIADEFLDTLWAWLEQNKGDLLKFLPSDDVIVAAAKKVYDERFATINIKAVPDFIEPAFDRMVWQAIELGIRQGLQSLRTFTPSVPAVPSPAPPPSTSVI